MSSFIAFGSGSPVNLNNTYEPQGWGTDGTGTTVTSGTGTNKTASPVNIGSARSNDWAGVILTFGPFTSSALRALVDISFDGGTTWHITNLFVWTSNNSVLTISLPVKSTAGGQTVARIAATSGSTPLKIKIEGIVRNADSAPGFTSLVALNADTTNIQPGSTNVPLHVSASSYTSLGATGADYGGVLAIASLATGLGTAQVVTFVLSLDNSTAFAQFSTFMNTANPLAARGASNVFLHTIPSGTTLYAEALAATPGAGPDNVLLGFYGLAA